MTVATSPDLTLSTGRDRSPWLRADEAAVYARCHKGQIFRAARHRQLEHVRIGGRGTLLTTTIWIDHWLKGLTVHVHPVGGGR